MFVALRVVAGPYAGRSFEFRERDTFLVGRGASAHFRLPKKDPYFSRVHFLIDLNPPLCRIIDLKSANGTFVNETRVDAVELHDGDRIQAGDTIFEVCIAGLRTPWTPPVSQSAPNSAADDREERSQLTLESTDRRRSFPIRGKKAEPQPKEPPRPLLDSAPQPSTPDASACPPAPPQTRQSTVIVPPGTFDVVDEAAAPSALPENWRALARALPQPISGYLLIDRLGMGSMGVVYRAVRRADESVVGIKMIQPAVAGSSDDYDRFLREASILKTLDHPHIVRCYEQGAAGELLYFVMDYVPGVNGKQLVEQHGPLPVERSVSIACQMLDALTHAHDRGYVHRDVKPANLLIDSSSGRDIVRLSDFGLARVYHSSQLSGLTQLGMIGGTIFFMPPEQITNYRAAPPESDQYAAAATLYYLLTGRYVYDFPASVSAQLGLILNEDPVPIASRHTDLPLTLCLAVHKALARVPGNRHQSAQAFRVALADR